MRCVVICVDLNPRTHTALVQMHAVLALNRVREVHAGHVKLLRSNGQKLLKRHLKIHIQAINDG